MGRPDGNDAAARGVGQALSTQAVARPAATCVCDARDVAAARRCLRSHWLPGACNRGRPPAQGVGRLTPPCAGLTVGQGVGLGDECDPLASILRPVLSGHLHWLAHHPLRRLDPRGCLRSHRRRRRALRLLDPDTCRSSPPCSTVVLTQRSWERDPPPQGAADQAFDGFLLAVVFVLANDFV